MENTFENKLMVDGGVLDVLPTDEARRMGADILIAVDVTEKPNLKREPANLLDIASNTIDIMIDDQMERNARLADVLIQPPIGQHPDTQYSGLDSLIDLGYQAAKQKMPEIKRLLNTGMNQNKNFPRTLNKDGLGQAKIARINIIALGAGVRSRREPFPHALRLMNGKCAMGNEKWNMPNAKCEMRNYK